MPQLLRVPAPRLWHLMYAFEIKDTFMLVFLTKLSQLRSLHISGTIWTTYHVAGLQCMSGLHNLEVGISTNLLLLLLGEEMGRQHAFH